MLNKSKSSFSSILKGEFISNQKNQRHIPFLLSIVLLILLNIRISFRAERLLKESISLEKEVADLRLVYITTKSDLMSMYKRSVIESVLKDNKIKTSLIPPFIIEKINE